MIKPGDRFTIQPPKGSAVYAWKERVYTCLRVEKQKTQIEGYDGNVLDLGRLVVFEGARDKHGKPVLHAVPIEWAAPIKERSK
jgi:hypothetical protein